jgi:hypothetical protein
MAVAAILIISAQIVSAQDFTVQVKDKDGKIIATHCQIPEGDASPLIFKWPCIGMERRGYE